VPHSPGGKARRLHSYRTGPRARSLPAPDTGQPGRRAGRRPAARSETLPGLRPGGLAPLRSGVLDYPRSVGVVKNTSTPLHQPKTNIKVKIKVKVKTQSQNQSVVREQQKGAG
jgi:hypothetical protein